ncbi:hypothetical protein [Colwellia sp. MB3u-55]|uniref:hypothetical protein n=1 Tax=Colwellia sp. MB3u-55 TaxID=2759810 RepID=UPI0015F446F0|nr:hypothetical protein [Colwellia sp. MB3u-55]MBA6250924.1 hypothetical protein [Colwellia sp. MB3u-55]
MDPLSVSIGFLIGTATGAAGTYYGNKYTDERRKKEIASSDNATLDKLWANHSELLAEMKSDMDNPAYFHHRDFWMLDSQWMFNHDGPYLVYHIDVHSSLEQQLNILESHGVILDVSDSSKNVKKFQFTELFVEFLRSKKI